MICRARRPHDGCLRIEFTEYFLHEPRSIMVCEVAEFFLPLGEPGMTGLGSQLASPVLKGPIADSAFEKLVNLFSSKIKWFEQKKRCPTGVGTYKQLSMKANFPVTQFRCRQKSSPLLDVA